VNEARDPELVFFDILVVEFESRRASRKNAFTWTISVTPPVDGYLVFKVVVVRQADDTTRVTAVRRMSGEEIRQFPTIAARDLAADLVKEVMDA
jgi:hypothetical protein